MITAPMSLLEDPTQLLRAGQPAQAAASLQHRLSAEAPGATLRLPALLLLAEAHTAAGDAEAGLAAAALAAALAQDQGQATALAEALCLESCAYLAMGLDGLAFDKAALALAQARGCDDARLQARALRALSCCERDAGDGAQAEVLLDDSLDCAQRCGDSDGQFWALHDLCTLLATRLQDTAEPHDPNAAAAAALARLVPAAERARALAQQARSPWQQACALRCLAKADTAAGRVDEAEAGIAAYAALARQHGWASLLGSAHLDATQLLRDQGRAAQAMASLPTAEHQDAAARDGEIALRTHEALHALHKAQGEHREALAQVEALARLQREQLSRHAQRQARVLLARLHAEQNQARNEMARVDALLQAERHRALEREHELLRRHANEDALTGLGNRRAADAALARHLDPGRDRALVLVRIDIDHFRAVNELHGHAVGDALLRTFGTMLRELLREGDEVFRLAGEGFLVLLPEVPPQAGAEACERLRRSVQGFDWSGVAPGLQVTASLGLGSREDGEDAHGLLARADTALYAAKRNGGNRVVAG